MKNKMKVFLGGTCNDSTWRDRIMPKLDDLGIDYFNPVVDDWTPDCQEEEENQKWNKCGIHLYIITPLMTGVFSIAEAVESTFEDDVECVFAYLEEDDGESFDKGQKKSLDAVSRLIRKHGGKTADSIDGAVRAIQSCVEEVSEQMEF